MPDMKMGCIYRYDLEKNPYLTGRFEFVESTFTRKITSKSDRVYSKMFHTMDYEEIVGNANIMKESPRLILISEPFLLDDELRERVIRWVKWANSVDPKEYDPFEQLNSIKRGD